MSSPPPQFLEGSFFVRSGTVSPSRPAKLHRAARAAAVKTGRRPPPEAARSGLEGGEHGARLGQVGTTPMSLTATTGLVASIAGPIGGELAIAPRSFRSNLVFGRSGGIGTMMQPCASAAKLRAAGPFYSSGARAMGGSGTPPPRIVIGNPRPAAGRAPNRLSCLACSSQIAACRRTPGGTVPVLASSHRAISSLRASATIMVFLVPPRPSCVRCRNHWTSALSG